MDFILDTHTFIWFINGEDLPENVLNKIKDVNNRCFISIASLWEIAIKHSLGKLKLDSEFDDIKDFLYRANIDILPIDFEHVQQLIKLPHHHNDPFDRLIISQGMAENAPILSMDSKFRLYDVVVQWN